MHGLNKQGMKADPKSGSGQDPDKIRSKLGLWIWMQECESSYFEELDVIFGGLQAFFELESSSWNPKKEKKHLMMPKIIIFPTFLSWI
jgi:hypothetical protein